MVRPCQSKTSLFKKCLMFFQRSVPSSLHHHRHLERKKEGKRGFWSNHGFYDDEASFVRVHRSSAAAKDLEIVAIRPIHQDVFQHIPIPLRWDCDKEITCHSGAARGNSLRKRRQVLLRLGNDRWTI